MNQHKPMANPSGKTPEERLDALEMRTSALSDAMIVQGYVEGRTERNLAELTEDVRDLTGEVRGLTRVVEVLANNQASPQSRIQAITDNQLQLQAALQGLIEQIDRLLRGERGNGHGST
jgi:ABC-type transporter Mla subunit MlaD